MNPLEALKRYFHVGTAEADLQVIQDAFVYEPAFVKVAAPPSGSPRLLVGRKGAGKTALIEYLRLKLEKEGVPVVLLRPDDFDTTALGTAGDLASIKRATFAFLTLAAANRLSLKGALATGHGKTLNAAALAYSKGNLDGVQRLMNVLLPVGKAVSGIDFQAMLPTNVPKPAEVSAAIREELGRSSSIAYIVIDDTDQIGAPREPNYLARIWGLLLGIRRLATEAPNLKCLVTLRTEVWRRLRWDTRGHRDQVDHFQPLVVEWVPDDPHIKRIWQRRMELAAGHAGARAASQFFESDAVDLPDTDADQRYWPDFLIKNARERPRDMIQFMAKLIDEAIRCRNTKINSNHVAAVIREYSAERVDYLAEEFAQDCDVMRDVVRSLAKVPYISDTEEMLRHLQGIPSAFRVEVRGKVLEGGSREDAVLLWALLHEAGVINGLVIDTREPRRFRHVNHADDPGLVSLSRWNEMQKIRWEIHPAFRSFLRSIRDSEAASFGISYKEMLARRKAPNRD